MDFPQPYKPCNEAVHCKPSELTDVNIQLTSSRICHTAEQPHRIARPHSMTVQQCFSTRGLQCPWGPRVQYIPLSQVLPITLFLIYCYYRHCREILLSVTLCYTDVTKVNAVNRRVLHVHILTKCYRNFT